jgi:aquaporin Z
VTEIVMPFYVLNYHFRATHSKAAKGFAGLVIGLGLTLIHLISIPVTNTSVNPGEKA